MSIVKAVSVSLVMAKQDLQWDFLSVVVLLQSVFTKPQTKIGRSMNIMLLSVFVTICAVGITASEAKTCHLFGFKHLGRTVWALESEDSSECTQISIGGYSSLELLSGELFVFDEPYTLLTAEDVQEVLNKTNKSAMNFSASKNHLGVTKEKGSFRCSDNDLSPMAFSPDKDTSPSLYAVLQCPSPVLKNTSTKYVYRYLEQPIQRGRIDFETMAEHNVHIALSPNKTIPRYYEIVIGGWSNSKSVIRRCGQCEPSSVSVNTQNYLSPNEFRRFWITFGSNGTIAVGKGNETMPFMKWTDSDPMDIGYVGYSTGFGSNGTFRFCNLK